MAIVIGVEYSRRQIIDEFGVSGDQQERAVLLAGVEVAAIVIKKNGINPFNGKRYVNVLTNGELVMEGENDDRGTRLERLKDPVRLFFSKRNDGLYSYEGMFKYTGKLDVPGDPIRTFVLVP